MFKRLHVVFDRNYLGEVVREAHSFAVVKALTLLMEQDSGISF